MATRAGEPQGAPKRARELDTGATNTADDDGERITLTSIREAIREQLREERHILTGELREGLAEVNHRIDTVEQCTTALMRTVTDKQVALDAKVTKIEEQSNNLGHRLGLLEGKFATAQFNTSSARGSDGSSTEATRPAIVLGGWSAEQAASETLRLVKQHVAQLQVDLDMDDAFVPGLRRGFAILPLQPRDGEDHATHRGRVQEALRTIRAAKIITGPRPEGGNRYFFATMSQPLERRRRAQFAGKIKRLILEAGGRAQALEVEYGTANIWYNAVKVASGVTTAPNGAKIESGGWLTLSPLARQLGTSEASLGEAWDELRKGLH